ncbi:hypothetical protein BRW65_03945 [Mycobacterium paraffinicum]|uniref:Uncharacterized protein n=1 Tax=Mycobacterium paraffinicum TaxID=53378 RepID=A0A1Q4I174_9MYCO|nr:hypothetical protein [Mycobacterium paraffinicum]OJZ75697.1 hypothetical protein BRW65_03945 [Mycobacterium paraffinicum]
MAVSATAVPAANASGGRYRTTDAELDKLIDSATGWRIWHVRLVDERPALRAPYGDAPLVTAPAVRAECSVHVDHQPPEHDCACGVYAVENVIDALYRLCVITANIATGTTSLFRPTRVAPDTIPVLAHVHLTRVRWINRAVPWSDLKCTSPEMRAGVARIEQLYLAAQLVDHKRAERLAERLRATLGVPAVVGYPGYTLDDWQSLPDWYRRGGPDGLLDDEYEPLVGGDRPHPRIPFRAPIPTPGETVWGGHVGRWDGQ